MRTHIKLLATAAFLMLVAASNSFASFDAYLKIEGNGVSKVVKIKCPDGSCATTVEGLKAGKYSVSPCNAQGKLMKAKEKANRTKCAVSFTYSIQSPRDVATGQASGKRIATTTETEIVSPRDPASGLPTGKRMHKPFTITKEFDRTSAYTILLEADTDGDMTFDKITWTWVDGGIMASDDWEAPVN